MQLDCTIPISSCSYTIEIWSHGLKDARSVTQSIPKANPVAIITDETVFPLHGEPLFQSLLKSGFNGICLQIPVRETSKTRNIKEKLENELFERGFGKDTYILALGGGIVTDISGYLAATYCRGIPIIMIPTSLLGMIDASIGGKNGVNVPWGKNLLGSIYQPKKIIIDPATLCTLPMPEMRNGLVEIIKHTLISDRQIFDFLEAHAQQILSKDLSILERVIFESCRIKKTIVEQDERDQGKRNLLNLGHTVGHALEKLTQFSMPHGEAVAIGTLVEIHMAFLLGILPSDILERIWSLFEIYGIPLSLPREFSYEEMRKAMVLDKKSRLGSPRFVLLSDIGKPLECSLAYCSQVDERVIQQAIQWMNNALHHHYRP